MSSKVQNVLLQTEMYHQLSFSWSQFRSGEDQTELHLVDRECSDTVTTQQWALDVNKPLRPLLRPKLVSEEENVQSRNETKRKTRKQRERERRDETKVYMSTNITILIYATQNILL